MFLICLKLGDWNQPPIGGIKPKQNQGSESSFLWVCGRKLTEKNRIDYWDIWSIGKSSKYLFQMAVTWRLYLLAW